VRIRLAVAAAALAVVVALAVVLAQDSSRLLATNFTTIQLDAGVIVRAGATACQPRQVVPEASAQVRMYMSTAGRPGPPMAVAIKDGSATVSEGSHAGGYVDQAIVVGLRPVDRTLAHATVCISNRGTSDFAVLGTRTTRTDAARLTRGGNPRHSIAWLGWFRAHSPSRFDQLGAFAERAGLVKASFFGSWTFWAGAILLLLAGAAAVRTVLREAPR
jgi:hypothetical protein